MKKLFRVAANDSHETSTDDHRDGSLTLGQIPIYLPSNALHGPTLLSQPQLYVVNKIVWL